MTDSPTPNTPLSQDDWLPGNWLRHERGQVGQITVIEGDRVKIATPAGFAGDRRSRFTFLGRPDQSGWIKHDGGPNPAPGLRVDVKPERGEWARNVASEQVVWRPHPLAHRITHWRPHVPAPAGEATRDLPMPPNATRLAWSSYVLPANNTPESPPQPKGEVFDLKSLDHIAESLSAMGRVTAGNRVLEAAIEIARLRDALTASQAREARADDILRTVCGHLGLPQSESGPADDVTLYDRALENLDTELKATEREKVTHRTARYQAEAREARAVEALSRPITMQDVRLRAGERTLTNSQVLAAVNVEISARMAATLQSLKEQQP